ncbi:MAG: hypothetical protein ACFFG0_15620 [Candidatus Thorarchaeota archaeon]
MNLLIGSKDAYGNIHCYAIRMHYIADSKFIEDALSDSLNILGTPKDTSLPKIDKNIKLAETDSDYYDYHIIIGNLRKKAEQLEQIRKAKKPVIAICDFDFRFDVEQYIAAGAKYTIVFKELK